MSETSPTETGGSDTGSDSSDLPVQDQQPSADEQQTDSVSSDTQDTDQSDTGQQDASSSTDDDGDSSSDDDDGLSKFAKAQGFDPENLTDGERKALKLAHDNQKAFRTAQQAESDKLKDTVQDAHVVDDDVLDELDEDEAREVRRDSEIAQLRAEQKVNNFYLRNPEAKEFDKEMTDLVVEEVQNNGKEAARYLAADLDRLLVLAKARRGMSTADAEAKGARDERERLRQRQEGSADSGQAQQSQRSPKKISRADIAAMDDKEYEEFRNSGELQAAIDRGDLY